MKWVAGCWVGVSLACAVDSRDVGVVDMGPDNTGGSDATQGGTGGSDSTPPALGGDGGNMPDESGGSSAGTASEFGGDGGSGVTPDGGANGGSAATTGGGGGTGPVVLENPLLVAPQNGFVQGSTNGLGIQGAFFTTKDSPPGTSTIQPLTFAQSGADICVSGTASQIASDGNGSYEYSRDWGVAIGLNLSQADAASAPGSWSLETASGNVLGFSFTLTGPNVPSVLRFSALPFGVSSNNYCTTVLSASGDPVVVPLSALRRDCFDPASNITLPANTTFVGLQWYVPTNVEAPVPFDFCIEGLTALVQ